MASTATVTRIDDWRKTAEVPQQDVLEPLGNALEDFATSPDQIIGLLRELQPGDILRDQGAGSLVDRAIARLSTPSNPRQSSERPLDRFMTSLRDEHRAAMRSNPRQTVCENLLLRCAQHETSKGRPIPSVCQPFIQ